MSRPNNLPKPRVVYFSSNIYLPFCSKMLCKPLVFLKYFKYLLDQGKIRIRHSCAVSHQVLLSFHISPMLRRFSFRAILLLHKIWAKFQINLNKFSCQRNNLSLIAPFNIIQWSIIQYEHTLQCFSMFFNRPGVAGAVL